MERLLKQEKSNLKILSFNKKLNKALIIAPTLTLSQAI